MSSSDAILTAAFNIARVQNNRFFTIAVFVIGVLGNLFNVIIFSQPTLSQVPTARYFLAASGASLASLTSGLLGRINAGWSVDPASYNTALCKFQAYTNKMGQTTCSYFILAAIIDRWLQSSRNVHYRQMSSIKNSTRTIAAILIVFSIFHSIHAVCYEAFLTIGPIKCYAGSLTCRYFENISYALITVLIPQCTMLLIGWKTIRNLRQSRQRINVTVVHNSAFKANLTHGGVNAANQAAHRVKIRSLTRMLIIQVFTYIFLTLPAVCEALYLTLTLDENGSIVSNLQSAIDRFFFTFTSVLSYLALSLPFYLYTLTGRTFRQTIVKIITKMKCCPV